MFQNTPHGSLMVLCSRSQWNLLNKIMSCGIVVGAQESHTLHSGLHGISLPEAVRCDLPSRSVPAYEWGLHQTGRDDQRHEEPLQCSRARWSSDRIEAPGVLQSVLEAFAGMFINVDVLSALRQTVGLLLLRWWTKWPDWFPPMNSLDSKICWGTLILTGSC